MVNEFVYTQTLLFYKEDMERIKTQSGMSLILEQECASSMEFNYWVPYLMIMDESKIYLIYWSCISNERYMIYN